MIPSFFKQNWWKKYTKFNPQLCVADEKFTTCFQCFFFTLSFISLLFVSICCVWFFFRALSKISSHCETDMRIHFICRCTGVWMSFFAEQSLTVVMNKNLPCCYSSGYRIVIKIIFFVCLFSAIFRTWTNKYLIPYPLPTTSVLIAV